MERLNEINVSDSQDLLGHNHINHFIYHLKLLSLYIGGAVTAI